MTTYTIRQILTGDTVGPFLPDFMNLEVSGILSDVGSISFDYAKTGANYAWLEDQREIAVFDDTGEIDNGRFVLEGSNRIVAAADTSGAYRKFTGRAVSKGFEESRVYASSWPSSAGGAELFQDFVDKTPGEILLTLFNKSKQFSEMNRINPTWNFSATTDSEGAAWPTRYSIRFDQGVDLLAVLRSMVDAGMIEFYMKKRDFWVAVPASAGTDRTTVNPPLIFRNGRNVIEIPEKTDSTKIRTVALLKGDDNVWKEVQTQDANAMSKYGRRVAMFDMGGTEATSMETIGRAQITSMSDVTKERTYRYHLANFGPNEPAPLPFRQYDLGDWVNEEEEDGSLSRVRLRQATISVENSDANAYVTLTLNSMILEANIIIARRLVSQSNGASGSPATPPSTNPPEQYQPDGTTPGKVTGVTVGSTAYVDSITGFPFATADIQWSAVTTNTDGSASNIAEYQIQYKYPADPVTKFGQGAVVPGSATRGFIDRLGQDTTIDVRVRAVGKNNNAGDWSDTVTQKLVKDTTPPGVPSTLTASPEMGNVRLFWDGLDSAGGPMSADFEFIEIYRGSTSTFTVAQGQMVGQLFASGYYWFSNSTYGTTDYFRARSKDFTGNFSNLNTAASATAAPLVDADIGQGAITSAKIADNAVTVQKIVDAAITTTKISDDAITTAKIAANAVTAMEMAVGTITASSGIIGDAAIVTAKIADAAISNAKIADATIQSAKIANLSVGKLTAGTMSVDVIVGGNIMTATSGQRTVMNSTGIKSYNSGGTLVVDINGSNNMFRGSIRATTFYSQGYDTGGSRYIEIGDVGGTESNDEFRFWNGSTVASIRNPAAYTGRLRLSANSQGTTGTVDIDSIAGVMANRHTMSSTDAGASWIDGDSGFVTVRGGPSRYSTNARLFLGGVNDHAWVASQAVALKLLNGTNTVQVRNSDDGSYATLRAATVEQVSGSQFKTSVVDINFDAISALKAASLKAWKWTDASGKPNGSDGLGLMVDDLPHVITRGQDEVYDMAALVGVLWEAARQMSVSNDALAARVKTLEDTVNKTVSAGVNLK